jgi:serine/threonine protein phosphatase PrpC
MTLLNPHPVQPRPRGPAFAGLMLLLLGSLAAQGAAQQAVPPEATAETAGAAESSTDAITGEDPHLTDPVAETDLQVAMLGSDDAAEEGASEEARILSELVDEANRLLSLRLLDAPDQEEFDALRHESSRRSAFLRTEYQDGFRAVDLDLEIAKEQRRLLALDLAGVRDSLALTVAETRKAHAAALETSSGFTRDIEHVLGWLHALDGQVASLGAGLDHLAGDDVGLANELLQMRDSMREEFNVTRAELDGSWEDWDAARNQLATHVALLEAELADHQQLTRELTNQLAALERAHDRLLAALLMIVRALVFVLLLMAAWAAWRRWRPEHIAWKPSWRLLLGSSGAPEPSTPSEGGAGLPAPPPPPPPPRPSLRTHEPDALAGELVREATSDPVIRAPVTTGEACWGLALGSHQGLVRTRNEDHGAVFTVGSVQVAIVADGMGGLPDGHEASYLVTQAASRHVIAALGKRPGRMSRRRLTKLARSAIQAGQKSLERVAALRALDPATGGLRTTLIVLMSTPKHHVCAYIGDGGGVVLRPDGSAKSFLDPQKVSEHQPNVLAASLGPQMDGSPVTVSFPRRPGDFVLIGSDGVFDRVDDRFAAQVLAGAHEEQGDLSAIIGRVLGDLASYEEDGMLVCDDNMTLAVVADGTAPPDPREALAAIAPEVEVALSLGEEESSNAAESNLPAEADTDSPDPVSGLESVGHSALLPAPPVPACIADPELELDPAPEGKVDVESSDPPAAGEAADSSSEEQAGDTRANGAVPDISVAAIAAVLSESKSSEP